MKFKPMQVVIAPNAFKGSLSAIDATRCIAEGLIRSGLDCELTFLPVADGGDDTASLLTKNVQGEEIAVSVHDPLGRIITASFGWVREENKAIIGMSDASGLRLLKKDELDPLHANTFGTGELIKAALDKGAEQIIIGVGGSATVDGGTGLLKALGVNFSNGKGDEIKELPIGLQELKSIDLSAMDSRLLSCEIIVLCDVQNKLLGKEGAAPVFGPQKGAGEKDILVLETCLEQWNTVTKNFLSVDMAGLKFGGAAGGIAAGLATYTNAKLVSGIEFFLDEIQFDEILQYADLVITGEGRIDEQTLEGKGPFGIARRAKEKDIPVIGLAGEVPQNPNSQLQYYFKNLIAINPPDESFETAIKNTATNLKTAASNLGKNLALKDI